MKIILLNIICLNVDYYLVAEYLNNLILNNNNGKSAQYVLPHLKNLFCGTSNSPEEMAHNLIAFVSHQRAYQVPDLFFLTKGSEDLISFYTSKKYDCVSYASEDNLLYGKQLKYITQGKNLTSFIKQVDT